VDFNRECLEIIRKHDWPGNIRELENRIQRSVIIAGGKWVTPEDLDIGLDSRNHSASALSMNLTGAREEAEKRMLVEAFEQARGNISHVARMIGTSRPTVHALIKKHGLSPKEFKE
jgi:two-component system NtrC family response regulator